MLGGFVDGERVVVNFVSNFKSVTLFYFHWLIYVCYFNIFIWVIAFTNCTCISVYLYLHFCCLFERKKLKLKKESLLFIIIYEYLFFNLVGFVYIFFYFDSVFVRVGVSMSLCLLSNIAFFVLCLRSLNIWVFFFFFFCVCRRGGGHYLYNFFPILHKTSSREIASLDFNSYNHMAHGNLVLHQ